MILIRSTIFYLGYVVMTIVMSALFILAFPFLTDRGRHVFAGTWCMLIINWLRLSCGVQYEILGLSNIPSQPAVYLSNHQSSWETILYYRLFFPLSPILKKELMKIPFWGWALRLLRPIAIDRSKPREAGRSMLAQGEQRLKKGQSVIVFPEGTRSAPGELRKFSRSGATLAKAAGVPIVPIAQNAGYAWPPKTFRKFPGKITVEIGEPISTSEHSVEELTAKARDWISDHIVRRP
ncbi:MAG: lysophospholipid acyltransferase family protein [Gammaproteobacteria bacterium]